MLLWVTLGVKLLVALKLRIIIAVLIATIPVVKNRLLDVLHFITNPPLMHKVYILLKKLKYWYLNNSTLKTKCKQNMNKEKIFNNFILFNLNKYICHNLTKNYDRY